MNFITEAKMVYSDRLETILKKIGTPLALDFLSLKQKDFGGVIKQNRLDIDPEKDDIIKFIPDQKTIDDIDMDTVLNVPATLIDNTYIKYNTTGNNHFRKILFDGMKLPYEETTNLPNTIPLGTKGKVLGFLDAYHIRTMIMYGENYGIYYFKSDVGNVFVGAPGINKDFHLGISTQEMKIGRFITRILTSFPNVYSNKDIEEFVNAYKSQYARLKDIFSNFEIVEGDDIRKYYYEKMYNKVGGGSLNSSCMRYVGCGSYFGIYCNNPEKVRLVILKNDAGLINGRALLWTLDDGKIFMDRIYYVKDSISKLFIDYAIHNGWHYKVAQNSSSYSGGIYLDGSNAGITEMKVTLTNIDGIDQYPYMDTMCYLKQYPSSYVLSNEHGDYCLHSTEGSICGDCDGNGETNCDECGGSGDYECGSCYGSGVNDCNTCDGSGKEECEECNGSGEQECGNCDGSGEVEDSDDGDNIECPECNGKCKIKCSYCSGNGELECPDCEGRGEIECDSCDGEGTNECGNCEGAGSFSCDHGAQ